LGSSSVHMTRNVLITVSERSGGDWSLPAAMDPGVPVTTNRTTRPTSERTRMAPGRHLRLFWDNRGGPLSLAISTSICGRPGIATNSFQVGSETPPIHFPDRRSPRPRPHVRAAVFTWPALRSKQDCHRDGC
jgi:hypothetical protein